MAEQRPWDVLTVDGIDIDWVMTVDALPGADQKTMAQLVGTMPGGPAANFACAASRVGVRVAALAEVGADAGGQRIIESFASYGVDTALIHVRPGGQTCFTMILVPPGGEKSIVIVPTFQPEHPPAMLHQAVAQAHLVYLMPQDHAQFFVLARLARAAGTEIMIDVEPTVGADRAAMQRILAETQIASFNQFGFRAATGAAPTLDAARRLLDAGPHTVVVTLGAAGSLAVTRDQAAQHPGYRVAAVDTTGAGDTFNAAFVAETLRGAPLAERLRFANAAAALAVTGMGPRGCLPTRAEIAAFLAQHATPLASGRDEA